MVILADDLGYGDLSINGNPYVRTPNIDSIARDGARFVAGYSGDAVCSPSRAALLTGRNPQRFGFEFLTYGPQGFPDEADADPRRAPMSLPMRLPATPEQGGLDPRELTIAELLKASGYRTGLVGKWHVGNAPVHRPTRNGFDEFAGIIGGAMLYAPVEDPDVVSARLPWAGRDNLIWRTLRHQIFYNDDAPVPMKGYSTDVFSDEAVKFIGRNAKKPFFLYLAYNAPHHPLQAPRRHYDKLGAIKVESDRVYYGMVAALDEGVGRVLSELRRQGLDKNTIVVFLSDNGGAPLSRTRNRLSNVPFRGSKLTYFEGGLNTPYFVRWPAGIKPGTVVRGPASHLDVLPTALAAARTPLPNDREYDGVNLLPALTGGDAGALDNRPALVWRKEHYKAVRDGAYMLQVSQYPRKTWLFDLERDPTEKVNLAERHPDIVKRLEAVLAAREAKFMQPLWGPTKRGRNDIDAADDVADLDQEHVYWPN